MSSLDTKVVKKKKLDGVMLKVTKNEAADRIFVEFSSEDGKIVLQKSFQNSYSGAKEAEGFQEKIKSIGDLKNYFGLKQ